MEKLRESGSLVVMVAIDVFGVIGITVGIINNPSRIRGYKIKDSNKRTIKTVIGII